MSQPPPLRPLAPPRPDYLSIESAEGVPCSLHTAVRATYRCACCRGFMCTTCDFNLGGGLHVCPTCAMASATQGLGSRRKRNVIWGYALAPIATITLVMLMVGAFAPL